MAEIFKPVLVESSQLNSIDIIPGQYIIVRDTGEVYVDKPEKERVKVSSNVYMQAGEPTNAKSGDIWIEIQQ